MTIIPARSCAGCDLLPAGESDAIGASRQKLKPDLPPCTAVVWRKRLSTVRSCVSTRLRPNGKVATNLARNVVTQWGFSDKLGHCCMRKKG
ncbi:hypothetical protein MJ561_26015 [Klebsiella pneumoniae]|nr:hypothetical protein MJ561_26015 [Klebsiella pneumoniae]